MPHPRRLRTASLIVTACLSCAAAVRGDRGGGIGADLAVDDATRAMEAEDARRTELVDMLVSLNTREHELQTTLRDHVRALYRMTRGGTAPVAGGFEAMRMHLSRVRRLKSMVEHDLLAVAAVRDRQDNTQQDADRARLALSAARERLAQLRTEQTTERTRADAATAAPADHGFYGLRLTSGENIAAFESLRGKLAAPVSGELRLRDTKHGNASALLFEAATGTSVRATAAGHVVYADSQAVVIDHGDGYRTAYGQLGNVDVRVGDEVSTHARLGSIGASGDQPALLFEIRHGARGLSPRPWLGL